MRIVLVTGGARGGKSRYAESCAKTLGGEAVTFVATATAGDVEMQDRIARHRAARPSGWVTVEAPNHAGAAIRDATTAVVLLDCVTMLTANALSRPAPRDEQSAITAMTEAADDVLDAALERDGTLIVVTNEVGFSVHPPTDLGRWYQNGLGRVNQKLAVAAAEVVLMVAGVPLTVKGAGS